MEKSSASEFLPIQQSNSTVWTPALSTFSWALSPNHLVLLEAVSTDAYVEAMASIIGISLPVETNLSASDVRGIPP
jgi:hypothetical protein